MRHETLRLCNMFLALDDESSRQATYVAEFRRTMVTVTTLVRRRPRRKATGMKVYSCKTAKDLACFDHNRKVPPFLIDCLIVGQNTDTEPTNEWRGSASTKRRSFHPLDIAIVWRRGGRGRVEGRGEEGEGEEEGRGGQGHGIDLVGATISARTGPLVPCRDEVDESRANGC